VKPAGAVKFRIVSEINGSPYQVGRLRAGRRLLRVITPQATRVRAAHTRNTLRYPKACATAPDVTPGGYSGATRMNELKGPAGPAEIKPWARDPVVAERLWVASEDLTGVRWG
jgi:hypothetical protein